MSDGKLKLLTIYQKIQDMSMYLAQHPAENTWGRSLDKQGTYAPEQIEKGVNTNHGKTA